MKQWTIEELNELEIFTESRKEQNQARGERLRVYDPSKYKIILYDDLLSIIAQLKKAILDSLST